METFKGFHVFAIDESFVELPDHPQTREEMEIPPDTQLKSYVARAKISCMVDAKMDFVVSSKIENQFVDEITLALWHLDDIKNKINLNNAITRYNRFYNATEIMLKTESLYSYYLIRGKYHVFKKQQEQMYINKTNDATFEINLNNSKIKRYKDEELKKLARKQKKTKSQNSKSKIKKWNHRSIIHQFTKRNSITRRIKTIIRRKMDNRKRLRQIKKQTIHRKIYRKKTNHHRTRLLQPHIPTKPTNRNKTRRRTKNKKKTKTNSKIHLRIPLQRQRTHRRNQRPTTKTTNRQPGTNTASNTRNNGNRLQRTSSNKNTRTNKRRKRQRKILEQKLQNKQKRRILKNQKTLT